jgi:hypothetical protein
MSSEDVVRKWLVETGYPLEMQVAAILRRARFHVWQSDFYVDPETKDAREIDVLAIYPDRGGKRWIEMDFSIECKKSSGKPWVLFLGEKTGNSGLLFNVTAGNQLGRRLVAEAGTTLRDQQLSLFHSEHAAYGVAQAFRSKEGSDDAYKALMQVVKAKK